MGRACGNGRLRRGGGPVVVCQEPPLGKEMTRMAYRLKPGKLGRKAMAAYDKVQRAFVGRFLEKDPDSPSGYALRTGETGRKAAAYQAIEDHVVGGYKKVETAFADAFLEETDPSPKTAEGQQQTGGNHEKE